MPRLHVWGYADKHYYLLEVVRKRLIYPDLKRKAVRLAAKYHPPIVLVEDKASGTQLIQDLKADGVVGINAYNPPPGTDKVMRVHAQTAIFENGFIHLPKSEPWLGDYVAELMAFPGAKHDAQVDSTAQTLDFMHSKWRKPMVISDRLLQWSRQPGPGRIRVFF